MTLALIATLPECLLRPCHTIRRLRDLPLSFANAPWRLWTILASIAFGGSLLYGASLYLNIKLHDPLRSAWALTVASGTAWVVLGGALSLTTRCTIPLLAHACMVTMTYGEFVLVTGAALNGIAFVVDGFSPSNAIWFNASWVGISNVVMLWALTVQLRAIGCPPWVVITLWCTVLNGTGAILYWLFIR